MNHFIITIGILGISYIVYLFIILRYRKQKKAKDSVKNE